MLFSDKNKALSITLLISGTVLLTVFNLSIVKYSDITENFYEILQKTIIESEMLEKALEDQQGKKAETNKAFNQNEKNNRAQAYALIEEPSTPHYLQGIDGSDYIQLNKNVKRESRTKDRVSEKEIKSLDDANDILKKSKEKSNNSNSTLYYSLTNRTHQYLPTPAYLCEINGKVIVEITVNDRGRVINAEVNKAASSTNNCLKERALKYAKEAVFNSDSSKPSQTGSITFGFIGKY